LRILVSTDGSQPQLASRNLVKQIRLKYSVSDLGQNAVHVHTFDSLREIKDWLIHGLRPIRKCYVPEDLPSPELPGIIYRESMSARILRQNSQVVGLRRLNPLEMVR